MGSQAQPGSDGRLTADGSRRRRVLVTGAAGFIGSHVAERLLRTGAEVLAIDNLDPMYDVGIKRTNLADLRREASQPGRGNFEFLEADLNRADVVGPWLDAHRPGTIIHLAARAGVRPSILDPVGYC
ncbi:MAG TPA: GDP-mannose 4,6-dehydratase, partial [Phycisphaerales bacterium]|nr:GDP-mannose 4,6-dehydratase [Phycisphaerales bacterium]